MKTTDLFQSTEGHVVAGVDEVGRGPLAGDVVAAAVILGPSVLEGLTDSKALSEIRRLELAERIRTDAVAWAIGRAGVCLLYTSPSPRDKRQSRMPSSA